MIDRTPEPSRLPLEHEWRVSLADRWGAGRGPVPHGPRVVRLWRGRTRGERADAYVRYLLETGVKDLRATPGNQGVRVLLRSDGDNAEFLLGSWWDSLDAIVAFAGRELERARYYPEDERFLLELEPHVRHYHEVVVRP